MSKSTGQIVGTVIGGVVGAALGFMFLGATAIGGTLMGAGRGLLIGSTLGGMIDPPPGPDLKGPTLGDTGFNSSAYGVSLATLHGTIAHTGSIIYLENNEYKAVAKKQKTGGKGGAPKGSYTTTTYFATFAVAIGEAMPGSKIRRIWAGGKLIYSVGEGVDWQTLAQSAANAGQRLWSPPGTVFPEDLVPKWMYCDGTQTEPDSRMEAVLGVGNCPSYEGTAYIIFYDFDLTEYGNGLQGCPIKVEVISGYSTDVDELPFQKILESIISYPGYIYDYGSSEWRQNHVSVRSLSVSGGLFIEQGKSYGESEATDHLFDVQFGWSRVFRDYSADIQRSPGLTFDDSLNWHEYDPTIGTPPDNSPGWTVAGWATSGGLKIVFGDRLHAGEFDWSDEPVFGAAYGNGHYFIINNAHIIKLSPSGDIVLSRATNDFSGGTYYMLWYDDEILYRATMAASGTQIRIWEYNIYTLDIERDYVFGAFSAVDQPLGLQFAVYGGIVVLGWSTVYDGGKIHYEQWRIKDFNTAQKISLDKIVGRHMSAAGVAPALRDLTALENDYVAGYKITEAGSARGKIGPLQIAYLFDLIEDGYTIKAVKRGGSSVATIPLSECDARAAGDSPGALVRRDRETESQLPSRYSIVYIDYNREYDTGTQYADFPSRSVSERNQQLAIVLSADDAAKLVDVLINLAWAERDSYEFSWPQKYLYLKPSNVVTAEVAAGVWVVVRISSITYTADQRVQVSARRAEPAVYQSGAVGVAVTPPSENISLVAASLAVILDIPAIAQGTTGYGFGAVMSGGPNWRGGVLLRSIDSGQTYDAIQAFPANCTIARAVNYLDAGDYFVINRVGELEINIITGDFFSISEAQMLTGKNYCAYGVDGRWEIIQYANATLVGTTLKLSTFVRGLFGTEWAGALHVAGDLLVLLDDPDNAFIGADAVALNSPRKFKSVTTGQDAQLAAEIDFTYRGVNLKPLSPVNIDGVLDVETWTITFSPRSRMASSQWATGMPAPAGEQESKFDIEIYDSGVLKNTYQVFSAEFIYSATDQVADFGVLPVAFSVKIYQVSAAVGRGYVVGREFVGEGDLYRDFVVLQLNCNGANGSTVFTDLSLTPKTVVANGDAKISTAEFKNGGSSAVFDGSGDFLTVAYSSQLGLGTVDFTIEFDLFLVDKDSVSGNSVLCVGSGSGYWQLIIRDDSVRVNALSGGSNYNLSGAVGLANFEWRHFAWVRRAGVHYFYYEGSPLLLTGSLPSNLTFATAYLYVGANFNGGASSLSAYFCNLRQTMAARYTSAFVPPSQQHPNPV
jgi:hypothetical protein